MATASSNIVTPQQAALTKVANPLSLPKLSVANPFAMAPTNPMAKINNANSTPATAPATPPNTGYGTNGAPMSVIPGALASKVTETYHPPANQSTAQSSTQQTNTPPPAPTFSTQTPRQQANISSALNGGQPGLIQLHNTFGSATGALLNSAANGNQQATDAAKQLLNASNNNSLIGQQAQDIANSYGQKIADVGQKGAMGAAGYLTTGTSPVGEGNAAVLNQSTAQQQAALAAGESANLQGIGYQLTGQNQLQSGLNQAGALGQGNQGLVQSGLNQAGGLLQPTQVPFSNQFLDPVTGQPVSGTAASPFSGGQQVGRYEAGQDAAKMQIANVAAKGIQNTITSYLAANPQLNSSDATFVNSINQWASGQQLGDPKYQTLSNYLNEYISTLAPVLGVGGDTTNLKTQIAQSMINGKASGQSIAEVLANTANLADDKVANIVSGGNGGSTVAGGVGATGGATFGSFFGK